MADQPKPPLWRVMHDALPPGEPREWILAHMCGAQLRALADWLVPEVPWEEDEFDGDWHDCRSDIRKTLLAEVDRAERGE